MEVKSYIIVHGIIYELIPFVHSDNEFKLVLIAPDGTKWCVPEKANDTFN